MKMKDRHSKILELLTDYQRISVIELSDMMDVSQVTIRKDLDILSERGLIVREHGFATLNSHDDINNRLAYHYGTKLTIAKKAAEMIHDGDTIMIESGSCCALLALEIASSKKNITIITNSAFIAEFIRKTNCNIVLLGGNYQKEAQVNVGPLVKECVKDFFVDYFFIGTDGFSEKSGFTGNDFLRSEAVKNMADHANKVVVITESNKFNRAGLVKLLPTEDVYAVCTDSNISEEHKNILESLNIKVINS